jgi:hypothetical protein
MDLAESATYLRHHLALAGRTDPLFADDVIARLHKASLGLPCALNNAAIAALIAGATAGKALVDDDCAKKAVAELTRDQPISVANRIPVTAPTDWGPVISTGSPAVHAHSTATNS